MEANCILHRTPFNELSQQEKKLLEKAHEAALKAFSPYSDFMVGAAALMSNGAIVIGSNQENIAYPSGLCGERVALFSAGAQHPDEHLVAFATVSPSPIADSTGFAPCGSCRQVLLESEFRQEDVFISESAHNLMPFSFRVKDDGLKRNRS
jgi:cytidine deaminase